ncbi:MAG TPA: hypothetical protein VFR81_15915 [Longimicrobium sp.]|nr:hypothetical protein [Longimicrobium sp.]
MHDLTPLDRLVEKLKTLDPVACAGVGWLLVASLQAEVEGMGPAAAASAVMGVFAVVLGAWRNRGSLFRAPSPAEVGRIPSDRRAAGPVVRVLAGVVGAFGIVLAAWAAVDGAWSTIPVALLIGLGLLLLAATGGGRVRIERPRSDTISSAS